MLPTFVIGLREGLEAALVVGIVATFLSRQGRRDALRWMWVGVLGAVALCAAVAVVLRVTEENLPPRQQEGLETIVGLAAVAMVTWMVLWMRRHARELKHDLEGRAAAALAAGSVGTLVAMAFLAVVREGFETAVFLLAAFQSARDPFAAGTGATLGIVVAIGIGIAIHRGGVRINLERFFRITAFVLVLVAAGLLATAVHTAHEAGWLNAGQHQLLDLTWFVGPGSVRSALLTGMLGVQVRPVTIEVIAWLAYLVPMGLFVLTPARTTAVRRDAAAAAAPGWSRLVTPRRLLGAGATATAFACVGVLAFAGCGSSGSSGGGSGGAAAAPVAVSLRPTGCDPAELTLPAGPTTFTADNDSADAVTELEIKSGSRIVAEVENVAPGLSKSFSVTLKPGTYTLACVGGSEHDGNGTLVVTGTTPATDALDAVAPARAVASYRAFLEAQADQLVELTTAFAAAVESGAAINDHDAMVQAKALYGPARVPYERIEPVAETFGDLDPRIDARAVDVDDADWSGFHKIEQALYEKGDLAGMGPVARQLVADVTKLQSLVKTVDLEPATIANGAVELLNEVSGSKVTGEEERYSHVDLVDLAANVEGSKTAFDAVAPLLPDDASVSATEIDARFDRVIDALAPYREGAGFVLYTKLDDGQTRQLAQAVDAVAEPLSQVAQLVVG